MKEYKLSDTQIAAMLYAEGINFLHIETTDSRRKNFVFENDDRIAELVKGFWDDSHKIAPRKLFGAFKDLKNRLYT